MSNSRDATPSMRGPASYRIRVRGTLDPEDLKRLGDFEIVMGEETVIEGHVADQAALSGLLNALYDHQFPVLSVECLDQDKDRQGD